MPGSMPGVRAVEIGIWVAGPSASGILADWGADVVKIESPAGDGRSFWLIGVEADRHWPTLLRILGRAEWATDERFTTRVAREQNSVELIALLDAEFAAHPQSVWAERFDAEPSFFWAPVNSVAEVIADPQTTASGAFVEVADGSYDRRMVASPGDFHGTPWSVRTRAPGLGQHTDEIRAELAAARSAGIPATGKPAAPGTDTTADTSEGASV
jgi:crotonobetainyl-CoA:carnitine CoA-transferase CaiB-like acyl-CoA transferase